MKSLVEQLETIGQTISLKQHASVKDMIESAHYNVDLIEETFKNSRELICVVEPNDEK